MNKTPVPDSKSPLVIDCRLPHAALRDWVSHYYTISRRAEGDPKPILQKMYPSDGTGLIFQIAGQVDVLSPGGHWIVHPSALAKGHIRKPIVTRFQGPFRLLCVSFRPGMACHFLRDSQAVINDRFVPLEVIFGPAAADLLEQVSADSDLEHLGQKLDRFFMGRMPSVGTANDGLSHAVSQISFAGGAVAVNEIARMYGQTQRSLERRFRSALGMTPKYFCETVRFRAFLRRLRMFPSESAATAAQECGYFDQAHQIREFRRFTGTSPSHFWSHAEAVEAAATDIRTVTAWLGNPTR